MKSRETLIRLKKFQVDEKRRRVTQIEGMIADFQSGHPDVRIDQSYNYAPELMEKLEAGALDVAICPMKVDAIPSGFTFKDILPGRNVIACGATHPVANRTSVTLSDIAPYPWIAPPTDSPSSS